ncbi:MAG: DUF1566 domain-containing protein [Rhodocyclales bacterium]|nr:DUF1566 domain-containing protein [Rhodocyclales bacterium]
MILGEKGEPDHHLFVMPGETKGVTFQQAQKWAKEQGGDLPTRREQSLLYANLKEHFQPAWYWSCEQHASFSDYAWSQYFGYGSQYDSLKSFEGRARAVRRLIIE